MKLDNFPIFSVGISGDKAIAGPIVVSLVCFVKVRNGTLNKMVRKWRSNRHIDLDLVSEEIAKNSFEYIEDWVNIPTDKINSSLQTDQTLMRRAVEDLSLRQLTNEKINSLVDKPLKIRTPVACSFISSHVNFVHTADFNRQDILAHWISRIRYRELTRINDEWKRKYQIKSDIPMATRNHVNNVLILGPQSGFHRRQRLVTAKAWADSCPSSDPKYNTVRFYRYRQPHWWNKWFPNLGYLSYGKPNRKS